jgi:hypothetical protein
MSANPKNTKPKKDKSNHWLDSYVNFYTQKRYPISDQIVAKMAEDLVNWAKNDQNAFKLSQFYLDRGIPHSTFKHLLKNRPVLKQAYEAARLIIGNRREIGALKNTYNATVIMRRQHAYDVDWKDDEVWRAELKAKAQDEGKPTAINLIYPKEYKPTEKKKDHLPEET